MIKINYEFTALQPLHTGSDENNGTERKLRREKVLLKNPIKIKSDFDNEESRRNAIINILINVWRNIDFDNISGSRLMGIYDEFSSKILASTSVRTKYQFLNKLCQKFDIRSLTDEKIINWIDRFNDDEFLNLIRDELQYLVLRLRVINKSKEKINLDLFSLNKEEEKINLEFIKTFDSIPYISGNSIRGYLRRVLMYDFCKRVGIISLDKNVYHQLFTGGNITESTGKENIEQRENFINMCPAIGLLGSAIGNQTMEGELKVSGARPQCLEHGTGDISFWELIETKFQTRLDSSKTENDIEIISNESKSAPTSQMIYQYETFVVGSKFNHTFALISDNELIKSCFYHMLVSFKDNNFIGGNSARDSGMIDLSSLKIPENSNKLYLDYLESNKGKIQEYFKSKNISIFTGA